MGNIPCANKRGNKYGKRESETGDSESSISHGYAPNTARRREPVYGGGGEQEKPYEEKRDTTKTKEEIKFIDDCCQTQMLFTGLGEDQRRAIINQMYRIDVPKGTKIIKQGDTNATDFYVIQEGSFDIFVDDTNVAHFGKGQCFGDLALLHEAPRAATVKASEDSKLFAVHRLAFRTALKNMVKEQGSRNQQFLRSIQEFSQLSDEEMRLIDMALEPMSFDQGAVILRQDDDGDRFFLIISGACTWTKKLPSGIEQSGDLVMGDYFGERALIKEEKRAATIIAKTSVNMLTLSKDDFTELVSGEIFKKKLTSYDMLPFSEDHKTEDEELTKTAGLRKNDICDLETLRKNEIGVLGQGAFGIVTLVNDPNSEQSYALKAIKKCQIVELSQQKHIVNEMQIMRKLAEKYCTFLVNLIATYKDELRVYFLLEVCLGGELFTILRRRRCFPETTARFYTACVTEGFVFMHGLNIIYRDLKPENLVLTDTGYLKITDFGFAKEVTDKTFTLCGTPDYLAPEIVTGQGHGRAVDWWTLGILLYEMVASFPPFYDEQPINTYRRIIKGKVKWVRTFSPEVRDLIQAFLRVRPIKRLGIRRGGVELIRKSPFFEGFDWKALQKQQMTAPIKNKVRDITDMSNFEKVRVTNDNATPVDKKDDFDDLF